MGRFRALGAFWNLLKSSLTFPSTRNMVSSKAPIFAYCSFDIFSISLSVKVDSPGCRTTLKAILLVFFLILLFSKTSKIITFLIRLLSIYFTACIISAPLIFLENKKAKSLSMACKGLASYAFLVDDFLLLN